MARKKVTPIEEAPAKPERTSTFGPIVARVLADEQQTIREEAPNPERDRAEAVAEQLSGTPIGREMLATVLTGAVDTVAGALEAYLTKLEASADGIDTVTSGGVDYRLIGLDSLTGWRRRQAWKLLLSMAGNVKAYYQNGLDMFAIAQEIAGGEKGVQLLGLAYGPVGEQYDKDRVTEYGEAVDDVLTTKQIAGVVLRFFSLSASTIATFSRNSLVGLVGQAVGALLTILPTTNANAAEG